MRVNRVGLGLLVLPSPSADLGATDVQQLRISDGYGFAVAGPVITVGTLGDRIGRRRLLLIGAAAFAVLSVVAAFATGPLEQAVTRSGPCSPGSSSPASAWPARACWSPSTSRGRSASPRSPRRCCSRRWAWGWRSARRSRRRRPAGWGGQRPSPGLVDGPGALPPVVSGIAVLALGTGPLSALSTGPVVDAVPPRRAGSAAAMSETGNHLDGTSDSPAGVRSWSASRGRRSPPACTSPASSPRSSSPGWPFWSCSRVHGCPRGAQLGHSIEQICDGRSRHSPSDVRIVLLVREKRTSYRRGR